MLFKLISRQSSEFPSTCKAGSTDYDFEGQKASTSMLPIYTFSMTLLMSVSLGSSLGKTFSCVAEQWSWYVTPRMSAISIRSVKVAAPKASEYSLFLSSSSASSNLQQEVVVSCRQ